MSLRMLFHCNGLADLRLYRCHVVPLWLYHCYGGPLCFITAWHRDIYGIFTAINGPTHFVFTRGLKFLLVAVVLLGLPKTDCNFIAVTSGQVMKLI